MTLKGNGFALSMSLLLQPELQIWIKLRLQHCCLIDNAREQAVLAA